MERVLYLDGDTIVKGSLLKLMQTEMHDNWIAGVKDTSEKIRQRELGMDSDYVNAGVILINMDKWREEKIGERLISFINTCPEKLSYADQDVLNAVCAGKIEFLELKYNFNHDTNELALPVLSDLYGLDQEELYECVKDHFANVVVWHYYGTNKPWRKGERLGVSEKEFLKYYNKSRWKAKRKFISKKKMLIYYLIRIPKWKILALMALVLGRERYSKVYRKLYKFAWYHFRKE